MLFSDVIGEAQLSYEKRIRTNDTGLIRPYRPLPPDFRDRFIEMGWDGIDEHYRTNWRVIRRWIEEAGGEELRAARRAVSGGTAKPHRRSKAARYVLGVR